MHRRPSRTTSRPGPLGELITTSEAERNGWTRAAQRHAVSRGDLERVRRGVIGPAPQPGDAEDSERRLLITARANALTCPRAVVSHTAAALASGLPTVGRGQPCLTVPAGTALRSLAHVHLHRASLLPEEVTVVEGLSVTAPARTIMDVARERGVAAGLVAADAALRSGLVDADDLDRAFDRCAGWPGRRSARIVRAMCDGSAESPLESLSRLAIAASHLPRLQLQVSIWGGTRQFAGRPDFYWDDYGVIGEADGDLKYEDRSVLVRERVRQQTLERLGLIVVRWRWPDVFDFARVAEDLRFAFQRGIRPGSPARRWVCTRPGR